MWNDKEADIDLLGHAQISQTIEEIIDDNHLRPLTIGVYGDWGVGKSSILSILEKSIKNNDIDGNSHTILFNGWLFQGYEDAKTALMQTIVSELVEQKKADKKILKLGKSLFNRINWLKVAKVSGSVLWTGMTGIPDPTLLGGLMNFGKNVIEVGKSAGVTMDDDESFLKEKEASVTGQIAAFRTEFKELLIESKVDRLIILVDDLDRCLPKSVIEILEAIRLFLFVDGTVFVISADEKMIEYAVREHFPNLPSSYNDYTRNYLEKLIQIPIRVPSLNRQETRNYIKFLMLQNHIKHDFVQLQKIYQEFESSKKLPYDHIEIDYQLIKKAIGGESKELQEAILVADQISNTLAYGLKGNPRNIKRFLNTLFLRQKIARIYKLDNIIRIDVLAKLMLLERFQNAKYDQIISEILNSQNGESDEIGKLEKNNADKKSTSKKKLSYNQEGNDEFTKWVEIKPMLSDMDLRPYIFISKEKAIGFDVESDMSQELQMLYEKLSTGTKTILNAAERELAIVSIEDATSLFNKLKDVSKSESNLKIQPNSIKGLFRIIRVHKDLEMDLITLLGSFPVDSLGVWAVSECSGLSRTDSKGKFNELLKAWATQDSNRILQSIARQTIK